MGFYDKLSSAFVTLLFTLDPPALAPLFLALTRGMDRRERGQVAMRSCIISFCVLVFFALVGAQILRVFGITIGAFRVAGGLLLFCIAFEMIFERRQAQHEKNAQIAITRDHIHNIAAFPLAVPLIAGPGAISATTLLGEAFYDATSRLVLIIIILACILLSYLVFLLAERIDLFLGASGRSILTRLLGIILAAIAVQFVTDGIKVLIVS